MSDANSSVLNQSRLVVVAFCGQDIMGHKKGLKKKRKRSSIYMTRSKATKAARVKTPITLLYQKDCGHVMCQFANRKRTLGKAFSARTHILDKVDLNGQVYDTMLQVWENAKYSNRARDHTSRFPQESVLVRFGSSVTVIVCAGDNCEAPPRPVL